MSDVATPVASWSPVAGRTGARASVRPLLPFAGTVASIALYALACPPYEWTAAAWIAPGLLLLATRATSKRTGVACGLVFGALFGLWITGWTYHATLAYFAVAAGVMVALAVQPRSAAT